MALKKAYRLSGKTRLRSLRTYKTRAFLLKVAANNSSQRRFGFIVPKTVDKRAVVRNKVRRMFQACAENVVEKVVPGHDMLFIVHP
ncbi:MAG: ribonuclease P protein component, partial [Candidatus Levybacteria bacterium]|nr:ribonuclease P protein component [Candidatus Levybacteria bacterium]